MKLHSFFFTFVFSLTTFCLSTTFLFAQIDETDNQNTEQETKNSQRDRKDKKQKVKKSTHLWGFNPYVGNEPYYRKGEFDINVLPIVYQTSFSKRVDFRINPILNFGFREVGGVISHVGFETAAPIFIFKKEERFLPSQGFYVAPVFSLTHSSWEMKNNYGFWGEVGYNLSISTAKKLTLSIGLQYGKTQYNYSSRYTDNEVTNHYRLKIIFGKWY